jgi:hypothetical protein
MAHQEKQPNVDVVVGHAIAASLEVSLWNRSASPARPKYREIAGSPEAGADKQTAARDDKWNPEQLGSSISDRYD